jgi:hypothetical protein
MDTISCNFTDINDEENNFTVGLMIPRKNLKVDKIKEIILSKIEDYTNNDDLYLLIQNKIYAEQQTINNLVGDKINIQYQFIIRENVPQAQTPVNLQSVAQSFINELLNPGAGGINPGGAAENNPITQIFGGDNSILQQLFNGTLNNNIPVIPMQINPGEVMNFIQPPGHIYTIQLGQMADMGFVDRPRNIQALQNSGGNIDTAIDWLMNNPG